MEKKVITKGRGVYLHTIVTFRQLPAEVRQISQFQPSGRPLPRQRNLATPITEFKASSIMDPLGLPQAFRAG